MARSTQSLWVRFSKRLANAQKAEEYGSHDINFLNCSRRTMRIVDANGNIDMQTRTCWKAISGRMPNERCSNPRLGWNWALLVLASLITPAVFWWTKSSHDISLRNKVETYLKNQTQVVYDIRNHSLSTKRFVSLWSASFVRRQLFQWQVNILRDYLNGFLFQFWN